jgi:hypothetical protein
MHSDSCHLKRIFALLLASVAGCSTLPRVDRIDWSGAHPFTLSNRVPNEFNPGGSVWGLDYEVDGVFKAEASTGLIRYRIDKLEIDRNPKFADLSMHLNGVQFGLCYHLAEGRGWGMFPNLHQGKTNSKNLSMTLEPNKTYTITDIGTMSVSNDEKLDLHKTWPCSLLWTTMIPYAALNHEGDFPAHEIALTTIE